MSAGRASDSNTNYVSRGVHAHTFRQHLAVDAGAETSRFCQDLVERAHDCLQLLDRQFVRWLVAGRGTWVRFFSGWGIVEMDHAVGSLKVEATAAITATH